MTAPTVYAVPGPADTDPVWIMTPLSGIAMHRQGHTGRGGMHLAAGNARRWYQAAPCERCWPVTGPDGTSRLRVRAVTR